MRELTSVPARVAGLADRGRIAVGYKADLNVIDHAAVRLHKPVLAHDLPAGGRRLDQTADGYVATIVSGEVIAENGMPTAARPGKLVRGRQPAPACVTRVAPLAPPWSDDDAAGINSWGHPDRTYEPLLLVRCLQRHPALAARLRKLGEALYVDTAAAAAGAHHRDPADLRTGAAARTNGAARRRSGVRSPVSATTSATRWSPAAPTTALERRRARADRGGRRARAHRLVDSETWNALGHDLDDEQRMELLIAVGWYRTICTLCNGLDLPVEGWMRRWPAQPT